MTLEDLIEVGRHPYPLVQRDAPQQRQLIGRPILDLARRSQPIGNHAGLVAVEASRLRKIENGLDLAVHAGVDAVLPGPAAWWGRVGGLGGSNESERHKRAAQRDSVAGVVQLR